MDAHATPGLEKLQEIVEFAISKEEEAIDFYTGLAARAQSDAIANELRSIAAMEVGHKRQLQAMDVQRAASTVNRRAADMKLADYLIDIEPAPNMTWQDVLNIAMKRELSSMKLYADLAVLVGDARLKQLFTNLSAEESKHKLYFESIWDKEILQEN